VSLAKELLTPQRTEPASFPETPYTRAREVWNDRLGTLVAAARNWRLAAFGALGIALLAVVGLLIESRRATVQPFYIRVAETGEPTPVGPVSEAFTPTLLDIRWHLGQWLEWTRSIALDPVVVKQNYQKALYFMRQSAATRLNAWAQTDGRLANIGRETVEVGLTSVTPIGGTKSFQVRWKETTRGIDGALKGEERWTATVTVEVHPPDTSEALQRNPIGLYVKDFQWSREL